MVASVVLVFVADKDYSKSCYVHNEEEGGHHDTNILLTRCYLNSSTCPDICLVK